MSRNGPLPMLISSTMPSTGNPWKTSKLKALRKLNSAEPDVIGMLGDTSSAVPIDATLGVNALRGSESGRVVVAVQTPPAPVRLVVHPVGKPAPVSASKFSVKPTTGSPTLN